MKKISKDGMNLVGGAKIAVSCLQFFSYLYY
jgi:hypothetical protein